MSSSSNLSYRRFISTIFEVFFHQIKNLIKVVMGVPVTTTPLTSTTLDIDDVNIAQNWLEDRGNWFRSDEVIEFNTKFAEWNESKFAFSFMGGRVALSAIIYALGLEPGDEVIIPGYTCVVVPNAFHNSGISTVYCDIELETFGLDASIVEEKITSDTKAILLHHLYGLVCRDYESIINIAKSRNIYVIEDCAQSTGAMFKGRKIGNLGDVAFYSSEQSKVFTTIQGGIATTNNPDIGEKLREYYDEAPYPEPEWIDKQLNNVSLNYALHKHPQRWWRGDLAKIRHWKKKLVSTTRGEEMGDKPSNDGRKMPAPIASLGVNQLSKIDRYNELRRETAKHWDGWCDSNKYSKPLILKDSKPVYLRYPILVEVEKKQNKLWSQKELGVNMGVWFTGKHHPVDIKLPDCPNADIAVRQCINFPGVR